MLAHSIDLLKEESIEKGIEQGELHGKQTILLLQCEKKFGISDNQKKLILSVQTASKLDKALGLILQAKDFKEIEAELV